MREEHIRSILESIHNVRIAVYGDLCLDAYWILDPRGSEISVETGLPAQGVRRQDYALGGAANIVANLAALRPAGIQVVGAIGPDLFGRELARQLEELDVDLQHLVVQPERFDTVTFCKPHREGREQNRVDFGFFNQRTDETDRALLDGLRHVLGSADAVILNEQIPGSLRDAFIQNVNALLDEFDDRIVLLDSRHYGERFRNVYRKTNAREAARLQGAETSLAANVAKEVLDRAGARLFKESGKPVFITRGPSGILVYDESGPGEIPGLDLPAKLDPVGAGDTVLSALACCLASGIHPLEAAEFANYAAGVTVQKLFQTGTASPEEILALAAAPRPRS